MHFASVTDALMLPADFSPLQAEWDSSGTCSSVGCALTLSGLADACRYLRMQKDLSNAILDAWARIEQDAALLRLTRHFHYLLFHSANDSHWRQLHSWPALPAGLGVCSDMIYALVLLSGLPHVIELHRARGIAEDTTIATLQDLELWMVEYKKLHGRWGVSERKWLIKHFKGQVLALGRLQFEFNRFPWDYHAWRHQESHEVLMLAGKGMRFRGDGLLADADRGGYAGDTWEAEYEETAQHVLGCAISPERGCAVNGRVLLPKSEWRPALELGQPVLGVHIPATGPMLPEACRDSFLQALEFFPRHYPEFDFCGFECDSWLLDAQLRDYLPPAANITRFLRDFYLYPVPEADDAQTIERVFGFGITKFDLDTAPVDTSLRRIIVKHMKNGKRWRNGGGMILRTDISSMPGFYSDATWQQAAAVRMT